MISIVIVNFNGEKYLKNCLDSLMNQTFKDFEIIIIDNNSTDRSVEIIKKSFDDTRVKLILNEHNLGFAKANNLGINKSLGEYILLLNNDTTVDPDFLEKMQSFYINNNFKVIGPVEFTYDKLQKISSFSTFDLLGYPYFSENPIKSMYLVGFCLFFSKDFYFKTKGLDENFFMYFEETDWFWRIKLLGYTFSINEEVRVYHAGNIQKKVNLASLGWKNQNNLNMLIKNYSFTSLIIFLPLYIFINLLEIIFFTLIFKPKVSLYYINSWLNIFLNLNNILEKRRWVQENRIVSDFEIFKHQYLGLSKLEQLFKKINFLK